MRHLEPEPGAGDSSDTSSTVARAIESLVDGAVSGRDEVERRLLESLVSAGLTGAAALWTRDAAAGGWRLLRAHGGTTPPPTGTGARARSFEFAPQRRIVVLSETFDRDGRREEREEALEALVALGAALADAAAGEGDAPPGPLRRSA